jgi:hypothetical protein
MRKAYGQQRWLSTETTAHPSIYYSSGNNNLKPPVPTTDKGLFYFRVTKELTNEESHRYPEPAMVEQRRQYIAPDDYAEQFAERAARHQASIPAQ